MTGVGASIERCAVFCTNDARDRFEQISDAVGIQNRIDDVFQVDNYVVARHRQPLYTRIPPKPGQLPLRISPMEHLDGGEGGFEGGFATEVGEDFAVA